MQKNDNGSVLMLDEKGECRYYRRLSGPLKAGQTVMHIEVTQTAESLDEGQIALLGKQFEAFLSTLKHGSRTALPDDVLVARLLDQTTEDAFNRLLKVRDAYAYRMIQAWTAEARYLLERLPARHGRRFAIVDALKRIESWSNALVFDQESDSEHEIDWNRTATNARRQAELVRRTAVDESSPKSMHGRGRLQSLFARLRRLAKTERRLFMVGGEEDVDLLESCREAVGPIVEWLACLPNDRYQASVRLREKSSLVAGVLLMPEIGQATAQELSEFCRLSGLAHVSVERPDGDALQDALCLLENDPRITFTT